MSQKVESKTYSKAKTWPFSLKYILVGCVITALLLLIIEKVNFFIGFLGAIAVFLFMGTVIYIIKIILYPGQFGVDIKFDSTDDSLTVGNQKLSLKDVTNFKTVRIRNYGNQMIINLADGNVVKFFSPQCNIISENIVNRIQDSGKTIETKTQIFPFSGTIYNVN